MLEKLGLQQVVEETLTVKRTSRAMHMYPTRMQDTNGNYLEIKYQTGAGAIWGNSSSRITEIADVRKPMSSPWTTYTFTYGTSYNGQSFANGMPHLLSVQNHISSGENWTFGYEPSRKIYSPLAGNPQFGNTAFLSVAGKTGLGVITRSSTSRWWTATAGS